MAEENKPKTDYSSNSSKSKTPASGGSVDKPDFTQLVSAKKVKPSLSAKFRKTFTGDDAGSVGQYLLFDVIIPRTKELIFDLLTQGAQRTLWGPERAQTRGSVLTGNRTNYSGISSTRASAPSPSREMSRTGRANHNLDEILIETRNEAELIIDTLRETIDMYEVVTLADLYNMVGVSTEHTDTKFGWTSLDEATIRPVRGGYLLVLPRAEVI